MWTLADGSATVDHEGEAAVVSIEDVDEYLSEQEGRTHRWFGIDQAVRLR